MNRNVGHYHYNPFFFFFGAREIMTTTFLKNGTTIHGYMIFIYNYIVSHITAHPFMHLLLINHSCTSLKILFHKINMLVLYNFLRSHSLCFSHAAFIYYLAVMDSFLL